MKSSINIEHKIALPNIIFFSIADLIENNLSGNIYILIATLVSILIILYYCIIFFYYRLSDKKKRNYLYLLFFTVILVLCRIYFLFSF